MDNVNKSNDNNEIVNCLFKLEKHDFVSYKLESFNNSFNVTDETDDKKNHWSKSHCIFICDVRINSFESIKQLLVNIMNKFINMIFWMDQLQLSVTIMCRKLMRWMISINMQTICLYKQTYVEK